MLTHRIVMSDDHPHLISSDLEYNKLDGSPINNAEDEISDHSEKQELSQELVNKKGGSFSAFVNLVKAFMGTGILSIPHAFTQAGLYLGLVGYVLINLICTYTLAVLIQCKRLAIKKQAENPGKKPFIIDTYKDVAKFTFGKPGEYTVATIVVILEIVFATGMVVVMLDNMTALLPHYYNKYYSAMTLFPVLAVLSWIHFLKDMWPISLFGVVVYLIGVIGGTYFYGFQKLADHDVHFDFKAAVWSTLPLFCGTTIYAMEGINLALPTESSMKQPKHAYWVVLGAQSTYFVLVCGYGAFGYAFGFGGCDLIVDCLPSGTVRTVLQVCLIISLCITHPLTLYPASEMLEELWFDETKKYFIWKTRLLRLIQVILTCVFGAIVPDFATFSAFFGSFLIPFCGFIIPPSMLLSFHRIPGRPLLSINCFNCWNFTIPRFECSLVVVVNFLLILLGIATTAVGTYSAVNDLVDKYF